MIHTDDTTPFYCSATDPLLLFETVQNFFLLLYHSHCNSLCTFILVRHQCKNVVINNKRKYMYVDCRVYVPAWEMLLLLLSSSCVRRVSVDAVVYVGIVGFGFGWIQGCDSCTNVEYQRAKHQLTCTRTRSTSPHTRTAPGRSHSRTACSRDILVPGCAPSSLDPTGCRS